MSGHEISENGLDMVCWSVKVIRAVFSSSMRHVFEYFDALSTQVGTICSRKTNLRFESHGRTSYPRAVVSPHENIQIAPWLIAR